MGICLLRGVAIGDGRGRVVVGMLPSRGEGLFGHDGGGVVVVVGGRGGGGGGGVDVLAGLKVAVQLLRRLPASWRFPIDRHALDRGTGKSSEGASRGQKRG